MKKRLIIISQLLFVMLLANSMTFCTKSDDKDTDDDDSPNSDVSEYGYIKAELTLPDGSKSDFYVDFEDIILRPYVMEDDDENIKHIIVRTDVGIRALDETLTFTVTFDGETGRFSATEDHNFEMILARNIDDETRHYTGEISLYMYEGEEEMNLNISKFTDNWLTATFNGKLYADSGDIDETIVVKNGKIDCALK